MIHINITLLILPQNWQQKSSPWAQDLSLCTEGTWAWAVPVIFPVCGHYTALCRGCLLHWMASLSHILLGNRWLSEVLELSGYLRICLGLKTWKRQATECHFIGRSQDTYTSVKKGRDWMHSVANKILHCISLDVCFSNLIFFFSLIRSRSQQLLLFGD